MDVELLQLSWLWCVQHNSGINRLNLPQCTRFDGEEWSHWTIIIIIIIIKRSYKLDCRVMVKELKWVRSSCGDLFSTTSSQWGHENNFKIAQNGKCLFNYNFPQLLQSSCTFQLFTLFLYLCVVVVGQCWFVVNGPLENRIGIIIIGNWWFIECLFDWTPQDYLFIYRNVVLMEM